MTTEPRSLSKLRAPVRRKTKGRVVPRLLASTLSMLTLCSVTTLAEATEIIRCTSKGQPDVVMTLDGYTMLGKRVSCISGEFISDMTPCATNGGYGLSYPTGAASLAKIVNRWQDYGDHFGGVTHYGKDATSIYFRGGFMSGSGGFKDLWQFKADRLTAQAKLKIGEQEELLYACRKAVTKF